MIRGLYHHICRDPKISLMEHDSPTAILYIIYAQVILY